MLSIKCPWCGSRDQTEFGYGGEAHIVRPKEPEKLSDEDWGDYLFNRKNTKGRFQEQWCHTAGCRRWFNVVRDSQSYKIEVVYRLGEQPLDGIPE